MKLGHYKINTRSLSKTHGELALYCQELALYIKNSSVNLSEYYLEISSFYNLPSISKNCVSHAKRLIFLEIVIKR